MKNVKDYSEYILAKRKYKNKDPDIEYVIVEVRSFIKEEKIIDNRFVTVEKDTKYSDDDDNVILCVYNGYTDLLAVDEGEAITENLEKFRIPLTLKQVIEKELMIQRLRC